MTTDKNVYTHGHHESVLRSHKWRTVENSAKFLLPYLRDGVKLLDAGCGPGNITAEIAQLITGGKVVGIDSSSEIIKEASRNYAVQCKDNLEFQVGDIYRLPFPDESFDVVYIHQVLQHLADPVEALKELRRVLKVGGILASREADNGAFTWYPELPELDRWRELYRDVTQHNKAESNGGRFLKAWILNAKFSLISIECDTWIFSSEKDRIWWGDLWSKRVFESDFAKQSIEYGFSDSSELQELSNAFLKWSEDPNGIWTIPNMEIIASKN